jgi:hypothetical protein
VAQEPAAKTTAATKRSTVAVAAARRAKKPAEPKIVRRVSREQRIVPRAKPRRPPAPARRQVDRQRTVASELPISPPPVIEKQEIALSRPLALATPLLGLGLLILGVSALAGRQALRSSRPQALYAHRSDLAAIGVGVIALALLVVNIAVLL